MESEMELVYCYSCNGSGEGSYDGSTCKTCHGLGEVLAEIEEEDEEEYEDPNDYSGMGWVDDRGRP